MLRPHQLVSAARVLLVFLAAPALVVAADRFIVVRWAELDLVLRVEALGLLSLLILRALRPQASGLAAVWVTAVSFGVAGCLAMLTTRPAQPYFLTLLVAGIEEVVFRREMPMAALVRSSRDSWAVRTAVTLLVQTSFAACHFLVRGHAPPFGRGLPLVRLYAAGALLATTYRTAGLAAAVAVHFTFNALAAAGHLGGVVAAPDGSVIALGVLASASVAALERPWASGEPLLRG